MDGAKEGGFETREGKIERIGEWVGESETMRITRFSELRNSWAARIGKTKNFGDFIEAFADRIITSRGDNLKMIMRGHADNLSMAARNDEGKEGKFRFFGEPVGINMRFKMMYWVKWNMMQNTDGASRKSADQERAEKSRRVGDGDGVDL